MSASYNKLVPKWMFRWITCELLCLVVANGKGYKPVNGKGCLNYIGMDSASLHGQKGGTYTVEQCAAAVKRLDGYQGCKGKYFFFETLGYCNCPTDDCTTLPNLNAGSAGQLYEFDPYAQASTTKPPRVTWAAHDISKDSMEEFCDADGDTDKWNCEMIAKERRGIASVGGQDERACLDWCASQNLPFCSFDFHDTRAGFSNRCCAAAAKCDKYKIAPDVRDYRVYKVVRATTKGKPAATTKGKPAATTKGKPAATTTGKPAATTTGTGLSKYALTFRATGCPATGDYLRNQKKAGIITTKDWWVKQSDEAVWDDMYSWYCTLVQRDTGLPKEKRDQAFEKRQKLCCGESYPCVPKTCVRQHKWTSPSTGPTKALIKTKAKSYYYYYMIKDYYKAATTKVPRITCDGTNTGTRADHTSVRQSSSTGYEAPGQRLGTTLIFPCRQGYYNLGRGTVVYTCGADGTFRANNNCIKIPTTAAPKGVWYALEATGCATACGARAGSGTPGKVVCSKGYGAGCDVRTKPQPNRCKATPSCMSACNTRDLLRLAGTHVQCTLALLGVQNPCSCLCTFAEAGMRRFASCAFGHSRLNMQAQWQACKARNPRCGRGDVVVVHGRRHLRQSALSG